MLLIFLTELQSVWKTSIVTRKKTFFLKEVFPNAKHICPVHLWNDGKPEGRHPLPPQPRQQCLQHRSSHWLRWGGFVKKHHNPMYVQPLNDKHRCIVYAARCHSTTALATWLAPLPLSCMEPHLLSPAPGQLDFSFSLSIFWWSMFGKLSFQF